MWKKRPPVYVSDIDPADHLTSEEEIAEYLRAIIRQRDSKLLAYAQTVVERARERLQKVRTDCAVEGPSAAP
jgi:DNA-binding phage protein